MTNGNIPSMHRMTNGNRHTTLANMENPITVTEDQRRGRKVGEGGGRGREEEKEVVFHSVLPEVLSFRRLLGDRSILFPTPGKVHSLWKAQPDLQVICTLRIP